MKQGKSLTQLAVEIDRRAKAKKDLVVGTQHIQIVQHGIAGIALEVGDFKGHEAFGINPIAHDQIGDHVGIPAKYYDKMLAEAPDLLATNVNRWFGKSPSVRMLRTLDGKARAFLSDKYRPLENEDLAEAVLPVLFDMGLDVMSSEITERRLYIKAVDSKVSRVLAKTGARFGDGGHTIVRVAAPAITISNSEVGMGMLSIQGGVYDQFCSNMATFGERSLKKYHTGARHELVDDKIYAMLSDDTRRKTDQALWSQVRDVVKGAFDRARFDAIVDKIEGSQQDKIEGDIVKIVNLASKKFDLNETEGKSVLQHLIKGGDLNRFGLYNAITRTAQDVESYDRATELEARGAAVIELPRNQWQELLQAA